MALYEVILSDKTDIVYRVNSTSEESAIDAAQDKLMAGEKPLYQNREDGGSRVRLVEPDPPVAPMPIRVTHRRKKKDFLTTEEAAYEMGVTKWTVNRYLNEGILKGNKLGRNWRIPRSEVERLLRGE